MNLNEKSMSELVKLYNKHSGKKAIKKFKDKKTAIKRTSAVMPKAGNGNGNAPRGRKRDFNLDKYDEITQPRKDTLRANVAKKLAEGATFEDICKVVEKFDKKRDVESVNVHIRAYQCIRLLNLHQGFGLKHDLDTGVITLVGKLDVN